jgi:hypothetical protein
MVWFISGLLVAVGAIGLLTGLRLAVVGLALTAKSIAESILGGWRGAWLWLVGAGLGGMLLTQDEVRNFPNDQCNYSPHGGFSCPAEGTHEIFWASLVMIAVGVTLGLIRRVGRRAWSATQMPFAHRDRSAD